MSPWHCPIASIPPPTHMPIGPDRFAVRYAVEHLPWLADHEAAAPSHPDHRQGRRDRIIASTQPVPTTMQHVLLGASEQGTPPQSP